MKPVNPVNPVNPLSTHLNFYFPVLYRLKYGLTQLTPLTPLTIVLQETPS